MDIKNFTDLTGVVLLGHQIPNKLLKNAVVVIVRYDRDLGTMGLCINQPLRLTLSDFDEKSWANLEDVPVFCGGPIQQKQILVTSMEWDAQRQQLKWQLGLNPQAASQLVLSSPKTQFKAYCGYVSWGPGELLDELQRKFWLPVPLPSRRMFKTDNKKLWDTLMLQFYPEFISDKNFPENPSLN